MNYPPPNYPQQPDYAREMVRFWKKEARKAQEAAKKPPDKKDEKKKEEDKHSLNVGERFVLFTVIGLTAIPLYLWLLAITLSHVVTILKALP
jgi:uncharacterized membrane protein